MNSKSKKCGVTNKNIRKTNSIKKIQNNNSPINLKINKSLELFSDKKILYYDCPDNKFIIFQSVNKLLILIYANFDNEIIAYNYIKDEKLCEVKNAHKRYITNFEHSIYNNKDLIISISTDDNNIKLWNIDNWSCILNLENIYTNGKIYSACFLNYNNELFIIASNIHKESVRGFWKCELKYLNPEPIKIYDLNGNQKKEIKSNTNKDNTFFIDTYYDKNSSKAFIITGNFGYIKSYDYKDDKVYHKYSGDNNVYYSSVVVFKDKGIIKLAAYGSDFKIGIWDFQTAKLLSNIEIIKQDSNSLNKVPNYISLFDICLWNEKYLIAGGITKLYIIDLYKLQLIKFLLIYKQNVKTIKKIIHPQYGECLLTKGRGDGPITLWANSR